MYTKESILDEVNAIRAEIGHEEVNISIEELYFENNELWIITEDRPDKSAIIGKGRISCLQLGRQSRNRTTRDFAFEFQSLFIW